jgi:SAM-dependent methyltransferase
MERRKRFEELYTESIDPWGFRTSKYERKKYAATIQALGARQYRCGVEAGCSIGELSRLLADECTEFVGLDISQTAIDEAVKRNADRPHMTFSRVELPGGWPDLTPDLVVLSEFLYFLSTTEIEALADRICNSWVSRADCLIVSFLGETSEALQGAESAALMISSLNARDGVEAISAVRNEDYQIEVVRNSA